LRLCGQGGPGHAGQSKSRGEYHGRVHRLHEMVAHGVTFAAGVAPFT